MEQQKALQTSATKRSYKAIVLQVSSKQDDTLLREVESQLVCGWVHECTGTEQVRANKERSLNSEFD